MGKAFTLPPGCSADVVEARLVDMFFKGIDPDEKRELSPTSPKILICE
jgi:hypothetical protein